MATTEKTKKTTGTTKRAATSKKSDTLKQIENLEKALEKTKEEDVTNLVPEEIKADIEAEKAAVDTLEEPKNIDLDAEVKKIIETKLTFKMVEKIRPILEKLKDTSDPKSIMKAVFGIIDVLIAKK